MSAITMGQLKADMCRWPIGDPKDDDFHFCGAPSQYEQVYCNHHMSLAHAETRGRTKKAV